MTGVAIGLLLLLAGQGLLSRTDSNGQPHGESGCLGVTLSAAGALLTVLSLVEVLS